MKKIISILLTLVLLMSICVFSVSAIDRVYKICVTLTEEATNLVKEGKCEYNESTFSDLEIDYVELRPIFSYTVCYSYSLKFKSIDEESVTKIAEQLKQRTDFSDVYVYFDHGVRGIKSINLVLTDDATYKIKWENLKYTPEFFSEFNVKSVSFLDKLSYGRYSLKLKLDQVYENDVIFGMCDKLEEREDVAFVDKSYFSSSSTSGIIKTNKTHISVELGKTKELTNYVDKSQLVCEDESIVLYEDGKITGLKPGYTFINCIDRDGEVYTYKVTVDPVTKKEHNHTLKTVGKKLSTYFSKGYTGDKVCKTCYEVMKKGKITAKLKLKTPKVKITAGKKKISIKYKKVKDATGFQVKYKVKGKTVTQNYNTKKTITKTIKNLKKGTYKVYVRSYVKQSSKKVFSDWSRVKTIRVK